MNDYRILVVDDEEDLCEILKFNLEMEGYQVDTANSAEEALKLDLPSYNLLLLAVVGGSVGALLGMYLFRHKTLHRVFRVGVPVILAVQLLLAAAIALYWNFLR